MKFLPNRKNLTPYQIAAITALIIGAVFYIILFFYFNLSKREISWYNIALICTILIITSFILISRAIETFLFRKIKTIYKVISKSKYTKEKASSLLDLDKDVLREVQREVLIALEKEQIEYDQLLKLQEYRKQFLSNVSHELKTPIFNIQGYLETLIDGGIKDDKFTTSYIKKALRNVQRMSDIIKDLEDIARFEDGEMKLIQKPFNIYELVIEIIESLSLLAENQQVKIILKTGFLNPCMVVGDREKIHQVLVNLLSNAIKYNKPEGKVHIGSYDLYDQILIEVSDDGIGISNEHLPRIFERFYRVDKGRSRDMGGTGLGLSIVKHIIEAHKQKINVRSNEGVGTTFSFTLQKAR